MAVPVVIQFLAETDDLVAQTKNVQSNVVDMVGSTKVTVSAVEGLVVETTAHVRALAQASTVALQEEASGVAARFKDVEENVKGIIESIQSTVETVSGAITPIVDRVRDSYEGLRGQIEDTSKKAAIGFAALGAGTLAAGGAALSAGQRYEDLRARLRGLVGDAEKANAVFKEAVDFAGATPFAVEEIVAATSSLQAFGQGGAENLRLVANISAATGQRLEDTALRVAKALSGASEGFQGLRDTSGITADRLARFGAVMGQSGLVSVKTAEDVAKARKALQELGRVEFAGNIERQSESYTGALSNAGDAVATFAATFGERLIPLATLGIRTFSGLVETATSVAETFSFLVLPLGAAAVGLSAIGVVVATGAGLFAGFAAKIILTQSAMAGANLILGKFGLSLAAVRTQIIALVLANDTAAASYGRLSAMVTSATARFTAMRAAASSAAAQMTLFSPLGIVAIGVALAAVNYGFQKMEEQAAAAGAEVAKTSEAFQGAAFGFRQLDNLIGKISGADLTFGGTVAESAAEAKAALEGLSDLEVANKVAAAGESLESLSSQLLENAKDSDLAKAKILELTAAFDLQKVAAAAALQAEAEGNILDNNMRDKIAKYRELEIAVRDAKEEHLNLGRTSAGIRELVARLETISPALDSAALNASSLDKFLKFAGGLESVGKLQGALETVNKTVTATQADILKAFGTVDKFELGKKLADPNVAGNEKAVKAIEGYLALLEKRDGLQDKITKKTEEAAQKEIAAFDLVTNRKKALGDLTIQEERARIEQKLSMVEVGTAAEVTLLEQLAAKDKEIAGARASAAKDAIEKQLSAVEESIAKVSSAPGVSAEQTSGAIRGAIASLEAFGAAQRAMLAGAPEAAEAYRQKLVELRRDLASSEAAELSENFKELKKELDAGIDTNGTTAQQLVSVGQAIVTLKAAMASRSVDQASGEELLLDLEKKKLDLIREQTDQKLRQVDEILALQQEALDGEIQVLEARKAAGENVEAQLAEANRARTQLALDRIDQVLQKEIDSGGDRTLAEQKAALAREAIFRKEALTKYQAAAKADQDIEQLGRRRGRGQQGNSAVSGFQPSFAPGGAFGSSPFSQGGIGVSVNPTAIPAFAEDFGRRTRRVAPRAPSYDAVLRQTQQQQATVRPGSTSTLPAGTAIMNATINIDGGSADPDARDLVRKSAVVMANQNRLDKMQGKDSAKKSGSPIGYGAP